MPVLFSNYQPPFLFRNAHFATIFSATLRRVNFKIQRRERLHLQDGDFIDLDWSFSEEKSKKLIIAMHGLSGNARRPYMLGIAKTFTEQGWDAVGINFRSCSGEINRLYRSYNAGATEDLAEVISHINKQYSYSEIALIGFSLGGNLLLKYLGESPKLSPAIKTAVAVSTPCDLGASLLALEAPKNKLYTQRFEKELKAQLFERQQYFPEKLSKSDISACNSLLAIDELYTSKAHGYKNAADYYKKCSCLQFLPTISIPTLLLNAKNDSFLTAASYPTDIAENSDYLYLEMPEYGGHVGFFQPEKYYYHEERALAFIGNYVK